MDGDLGNASVRAQEGTEALQTVEHSAGTSARDADDTIDVIHQHGVGVVVITHDVTVGNDDVAEVKDDSVGGRGLGAGGGRYS